MIALLNWRACLYIALIVFLSGTHWKAFTLGRSEGLAQLNAYKLEQSSQTVKLLEKRDAETAALQAEADKTRSQKNAEIRRLNTDLATALDSLHNRPERPGESGVPGNTSTEPVIGATGAQLFKEDSEFLVREADRADRVRLDLIECQAAYERARQALR